MDLIEALRKVLPAKAILTAPEDRAAFEADWRHVHNHPAICVVLPETTAQVAAVVLECAKAGIGIVPQGGNTGLVAGGVPVADASQIILSLNRMRAIRDIDIAADTITVEAGVTLQAVQQEAARHGRLFPVSLGAEGTAQIGGVISTNAGGIQVLSYGSMRAMVLGLEVVLADGQVWNGLRALRKDNTGFDLKQLFIGGEGMLGIITAATLRLFPAVTSRATALAGVLTVEAALALFQAARAEAGPALTMCEFISRPSMDLAVAHTQGGRLPFEAAAYVLLELSGLGADRSMMERLETILAPGLDDGALTDAVIAQSERERLDLLALREAVPEGELAEGGAIKHDIAVPLALIPAMVHGVEKWLAADVPDCRLNVFGHIGDGNLHINVRPPAGQTLADLADRKQAVTLAVESLAVRFGGSFSAEHGIGQMRIIGMERFKSPVELGLMWALKHALDPAGVLNPHKMLPEQGSDHV